METLPFLAPVGPSHYLLLSALTFGIGAAGVLARRNVFIVLMGVELMLNAAHLAFATFAKVHGNADGHAAVLFGIAVAAAEVCVGLAVVIAVFRLRESVDVDAFRTLKE